MKRFFLSCFVFTAVIRVDSYSQPSNRLYSSKLPIAGWVGQLILDNEVLIELPMEFKKVSRKILEHKCPFEVIEADSFTNRRTTLTFYKTDTDFPVDKTGLKFWNFIDTQFPNDIFTETGFFNTNGSRLYFAKASSSKKINIRLFANHHGKLFHANIEAAIAESKHADRAFEHVVASLRFTDKIVN